MKNENVWKTVKHLTRKENFPSDFITIKQWSCKWRKTTSGTLNENYISILEISSAEKSSSVGNSDDESNLKKSYCSPSIILQIKNDVNLEKSWTTANQ